MKNKSDSAFLYKMSSVSGCDIAPLRMIVKYLGCEPIQGSSIIKCFYDGAEEGIHTDKPSSFWNQFEKGCTIEIEGYLIELPYITPKKIVVYDAYEVDNENHIEEAMNEEISLGFAFKENVIRPLYALKAMEFSRNLEKYLCFMVMERAISYETAKRIRDMLLLESGWKAMWRNEHDGTVSVYIAHMKEEVIRLSTVVNWIIDQLREDVIAKEKIEPIGRIETLVEYLDNFKVTRSYEYFYSNIINCDNFIITDGYIYFREEDENDVPGLFAILYPGKFDKGMKLYPWYGELLVDSIERRIFYSEKTKCLYCNKIEKDEFCRIYVDIKKVETCEGKLVAITGAGREWYVKDSGLYYREYDEEVFVCDFEHGKIYEVCDNSSIIVEPDVAHGEMFEPYKYNVDSKKYSINEYRTNLFLWKLLVAELYHDKTAVLESKSLSYRMFFIESQTPPKEYNVFEIRTKLKSLTHDYYDKNKVNKLFEYIDDMIYNNNKLVDESKIDLYKRLVNVVK